MYDKFEARRKQNHKSAYAMFDWYNQQHYRRYKRYVDAMPRKLTCQDCGGAGSYEESVSYFDHGPRYECGWCEGTGYVTPWRRAAWLRAQQHRKKVLAEIAA